MSDKAYLAALEKVSDLKHQRDQLRKALRRIDADLEARNFLESSSLRDTAHAALKATEES